VPNFLSHSCRLSALPETKDINYITFRTNAQISIRIGEPSEGEKERREKVEVEVGSARHYI
jgi:hypothetical protein